MVPELDFTFFKSATNWAIWCEVSRVRSYIGSSQICSFIVQKYCNSITIAVS